MADGLSQRERVRMRVGVLALACATLSATAIVAAWGGSASAHSGFHPNDSGFFNRCEQSAVGTYDPILNHGEGTGVTHRHVFAGGDVKHDSTYSQLRSGGTTCHWGILGEDAVYEPGNKSGYWVPDVYIPSDGKWAQLKQLNAYYHKGDYHTAHDIQAFPEGFKMIARDSSGPQAQVDWYCSSLSDGNAKDYSASPHDCTDAQYPYVTVRITFPQCGARNAEGLPKKQSPNGMDHVAYTNSNDGCPSGFPVKYPSLSEHIKYDTWKGNGLRMSGMDPATEFHADYFMAWDSFCLTGLIQDTIHQGERQFSRPDLAC